MPYEKVGKNEPVCIVDEVLFEIPDTWRWERFGNIMINKDSERIPLSVSERSNLNKIYDYYGASGIIDKVDNYLFDKPLLLIGEDGANLLNRSTPIAFIAEGKYWVNNHAHVLDAPEGILLSYMALYINSISLAKYVTGTAQPKMNQANMNSILVPVPPTNEQGRIIDAINDITPYVDNYRATSEKLQELNLRFPNELKKSILQQAVMGKLVPQDPNDEPASVLLERIRAEKEALIKAGKLKKDKHESIIYRRDNSHYEKVDDQELCIDEEIPCDIPDSWSWCRLNDLVSFIGGYAYKSGDFVTQSEYQVLRLGNIKNDTIIKEKNPVFIPCKLAEATSSFVCKENDILLTMTGTRGKRDYFFTVRIKEEQNLFINQRVGCLRSHISNISEWLIYALKSECVLSQIFEHETGTANQGNLGAESIMHTLVPLPPFSEQRRIIIALCQVLDYISTL